MAASDPDARRAAASIAARTRVAGLDPAGRRQMTDKARAALRRRDRDEALRRLAEAAGYSGPFASDVVDQLADEVRRERMTALSAAGVEARAARRAAA